jgi:hypothetical protein
VTNAIPTTRDRSIGTCVRRYVRLWPVVSWGLFVAVGAYCVAAVLGLAYFPDPLAGIVPVDAWNDWNADPYTSVHARYSPAFYVVIAPLRALPWEAFLAVWIALHFVAIAWLGPWTIVFAFDDVIRGNITTFLAVAVVFAVRGQAWAWAAVLLTKVTPGVGVLYHVGRREWRAVGFAFGATLLLVAVTWPTGLWPDWFEALAAAPDNYPTVDLFAPLPVRFAAGAVLCLAAARWVWLLPVGMIVAMPGLLPSSFALLAALPRLLRR